MTYDTPWGKKLSGYMFFTRSVEERGPQVGGPLTVWHYHVFRKRLCLTMGSGLLWLEEGGMADEQGNCRVGRPSYRSAEMIHVWFVDHPDGRFAPSMQLPGVMVKDLPGGHPGHPGMQEPR